MQEPSAKQTILPEKRDSAFLARKRDGSAIPKRQKRDPKEDRSLSVISGQTIEHKSRTIELQSRTIEHQSSTNRAIEHQSSTIELQSRTIDTNRGSKWCNRSNRTHRRERGSLRSSSSSSSSRSSSRSSKR